MEKTTVAQVINLFSRAQVVSVSFASVLRSSVHKNRREQIFIR